MRRPGDQHNATGEVHPAEESQLPGEEQVGTEGNAGRAADESGVDGDRVSQARRAGRGKKRTPLWIELPLLIVVALVLTFLIQTFLARVYVIPSGSMEQTLHGCPGCTGDRIIVDKVTYDFTDPAPGDVVVFKGPTGWDNSEYNFQTSSNVFVHWVRQFGSSIGIGKPDEYDLVKRVIAVGGQTVSCCDAKNRVVVDGKSLHEPYLYFEPGVASRATPGDPQAPQLGKQAAFHPVRIPQGKIMVMGDNRNNSDDSRYQNGGGVQGLVPVSDVIGKARVIMWPPSRWQGVRTVNPQAMALPAPQRSSVSDPVVPHGVAMVLTWPMLLASRKLGSRRRKRH
ncbi:MAG: signal peptidase I [Sciscionella sp.]